MEPRIKEVMKEKGMTSASLAEKVGIHKTSVSLIINGKMNPTLDTIEKMADALGVHFGDLYISNMSKTEDLRPNTVCPHCGKPIEVSLTKKEV